MYVLTYRAHTRIYRSSHTSTSSRLTWRNEIPAAAGIVHRENRFQGGGQNPFQAPSGEETGTFLPREIKKQRRDNHA